jgi:hypothetical protein
MACPCSVAREFRLVRQWRSHAHINGESGRDLVGETRAEADGRHRPAMLRIAICVMFQLCAEVYLRPVTTWLSVGDKNERGQQLREW